MRYHIDTSVRLFYEVIRTHICAYIEFGCDSPVCVNIRQFRLENHGIQRKWKNYKTVASQRTSFTPPESARFSSGMQKNQR